MLRGDAGERLVPDTSSECVSALVGARYHNTTPSGVSGRFVYPPPCLIAARLVTYINTHEDPHFCAAFLTFNLGGAGVCGCGAEIWKRRAGAPSRKGWQEGKGKSRFGRVCVHVMRAPHRFYTVQQGVFDSPTLSAAEVSNTTMQCLVHY